MGYDVSFHPISPEEMREWYFTPLTWIQQGQEEKVLALAAQHGMEDFYAEKYLNTLRVGAETESNELFDKSHGFYIAVIQGFFRDYYYTRGSAFSFLVDLKPEYARYFTSWEQITPVSFPNPMQNRIIENYRFHNEIIEITLEDYLKENPDKTEHDFAELKALSDQIYYEQDRAESAQTRKDVSIHGLEETEHCATRALDEEWEERVVDIQNRKYAWKALEQLFTVGALTEVQKRRFRLHVFQGLSTRQIGRMEGTSHQAVAKSINLAIAKLKKYFAAQG